jgi:hypothetical protein
MRTSLYVLAAAATLSLACSASQAMPVTGGAMRDAMDETNLWKRQPSISSADIVIASTLTAGMGQVGIAADLHFDVGWGGAEWEYGPAARRFGRGGGVTIREGGRYRDGVTIREGGSRRGGMTVREGTRQGTTSTREGTPTRSRVSKAFRTAERRAEVAM